MYGLNIMAVFLLVISFVLPYLPPSIFPSLSLLSLGVSPLLLINLLFGIYWLIRLKKQFLLSFLVLLIAYFHFNPFFEISSEGDPTKYKETLTLLSYNVHLFNAYEPEPNPEEVKQQISELIKTENPDVICIQEYYDANEGHFSDYPYRFIHFKDTSNALGHAIFSKYPIVNRGGFDFPNSYNNTIYADIKKGNDTLRIYNLHLQSLGILPSVAFLQSRGTDKIKKRISETFVIQEEQINSILEHKSRSKYPVIVSGDFNNTPFSYTYRSLKKNMNDAFLERGNGLGTTYLFNRYPMRIDYIFGSESMDVVKFNTIKNTFSDHYPVSATFGWN
ncbi:MAG: endonuclease/exonuclease/phosphatase family protein [Flavobacteriaceae bacterium]|nr:endonuclease/exonuclease/phosphatase family protein [Flavobacteriaceae bacterium]